jgi:superfamily II DNA or RNA helicase
VTLPGGSTVQVRRRGTTPSQATALEIERPDFDALPDQPAAGATRWVHRDQVTSPSEVLEALEGRFQLVEEDRTTGRPGLRTPQIGAIHAVLAHWSTESRVPATVVLPTGTGKTETMLSLVVRNRLPCVLVLVPSDNLRNQIADAFETFGVLPQAGVLDPAWPGLVVGRITHRFSSAANARAFAAQCNVIVATPSALNQEADASTFKALVDRCTHLFVDEAHHVVASTWKRVRDAFADKLVVQFTATPYRTDGEPIGGRVIYSFPLGLAQRAGYFETIRYQPVVAFVKQDEAVARAALAQLRADLDAGFDHLIMARVRNTVRADEVVEIYSALAPEFAPRALHSKLEPKDRHVALAALQSRASRVIVCVNMLGEGYDFPELKVAAMHDPHRSLGVTLQFIGRFARTRTDLGNATAVVPRPDPGYDDRLRALYAERNQWDEVIERLATKAVGDVELVDEFEAGFGEPAADEIATQVLRPKMSTVVYSTGTGDWNPSRLRSLFHDDDVVSGPAVNATERVAWIVFRRSNGVRWADADFLQDVDHHLYLLHWDAERQLLYIYTSDLDGELDQVAATVCGQSVQRIAEEQVFRVLADLKRPVPTAVGLLDLRNSRRRFAMFVGADVYEGFPVVDQQSKTNTNLSVVAYDRGERVTLSAARKKGRIWSHQSASSIYQWVAWARALGPKLLDESMDLRAVFRSFVRPAPLTERPPHAPLLIDWSWMPLDDVSESVVIRFGGVTYPLIDAALRLNNHNDSGPINYVVEIGDQQLAYEATVENEQLVHRALADEAEVLPLRAEPRPLSQYLNETGCLIWFETDKVVAGSVLYEFAAEAQPPIEADKLLALDWDGIDITKESQGVARNANTVQARANEYLQSLSDWAVVVDDDGTGEIADLVGLRWNGEELEVGLVHCKYSSKATVGARVTDLYEVCGQAQRSAHYKQSPAAMLDNLVRRERARQRKGRSGMLTGDEETLLEFAEAARRSKVGLCIFIAQPGLSRAGAQIRHLSLLGVTDKYVSDVAYGRFECWCSA